MTEKKVFYIHYKEKKEKQCWSVKKGNTETLQN